MTFTTGLRVSLEGESGRSAEKARDEREEAYLGGLLIPLGAGHVDEKIRRRIWVIVLIPLGGGHVDEKKRRRIWVVVVVVNGDGRVQTVGGAVGHRVDALSGGGDQ